MTCTYFLTCLLIRSHMLVTSCLLQLLAAFFFNPIWYKTPSSLLSTSCYCKKNQKKKFREKERKKREKSGRKVGLDDPFSPSCDFNQCVMVWLRAEGLVFKSLESPKFFSLGFYRRVFSLKFISTKFILKLEEIVLNIIKYGSINHVKFYYKPVFQNIPV
ncbi:hypothetical protein IGI04_026040 [Brassica rapa subsp. trilocularis]|uniref:Uncharacterized protein n=1 Tax=Brassica rapa subsp. trilocularis TaxID=1813537 RepID=A0ABQ7KV64_BRACM|nr:hypothetical protein IGI04_026040 [Brassica rapa subsp. trilocularis]